MNFAGRDVGFTGRFQTPTFVAVPAIVAVVPRPLPGWSVKKLVVSRLVGRAILPAAGF